MHQKRQRTQNLISKIQFAGNFYIRQEEDPLMEYLHIEQLDGSTTSSGQRVQDIHSSAVSVPWGPILEDFGNLWVSLDEHSKIAEKQR